jgi:hypothetical protein
VISPPHRGIIFGIELEKEKTVWLTLVSLISFLGDFIGFEYLGSPHIFYDYYVGYVQDLLETLKQKTETTTSHR